MSKSTIGDNDTQIPTEFTKIIYDLVNDILTTFPEYMDGLDADLFNIKETKDEDSIERYAERAARLHIANLLVEYGFDVEMEDVSVVDELNAVYRLVEVTVEGYDDVVMTFDFMMNGETAINLFVKIYFKNATYKK